MHRSVPPRIGTDARNRWNGYPNTPGIHSLSHSSAWRPYSTEMETPDEISSRGVGAGPLSTSWISARSLVALAVSFGVLTVVFRLVAITDGRPIPSDDAWASGVAFGIGRESQ